MKPTYPAILRGGVVDSSKKSLTGKISLFRKKAGLQHNHINSP
jgi:hypothetical protein